MPTIQVYLPDYQYEQLQEEKEEREIKGAKLSKSKIIQEALTDRYKKS